MACRMLDKRPLVINGRLANRELSSLKKIGRYANQCLCVLVIALLGTNLKQDRRWNADKPSATLDL